MYIKLCLIVAACMGTASHVALASEAAPPLGDVENAISDLGRPDSFEEACRRVQNAPNWQTPGAIVFLKEWVGEHPEHAEECFGLITNNLTTRNLIDRNEYDLPMAICAIGTIGLVGQSDDLAARCKQFLTAFGVTIASSCILAARKADLLQLISECCK
ncbi:MAG: hypothetical protein QG604_673 [Candidatus Dependentiae bacterium]|nr:hypothetical protein [Candidatus Dependentiae bacterium]